MGQAGWIGDVNPQPRGVKPPQGKASLTAPRPASRPGLIAAGSAVDYFSLTGELVWEEFQPSRVSGPVQGPRGWAGAAGPNAHPLCTVPPLSPVLTLIIPRLHWCPHVSPQQGTCGQAARMLTTSTWPPRACVAPPSMHHVPVGPPFFRRAGGGYHILGQGPNSRLATRGQQVWHQQGSVTRCFTYRRGRRRLYGGAPAQVTQVDACDMCSPYASFAPPPAPLYVAVVVYILF